MKRYGAVLLLVGLWCNNAQAQSPSPLPYQPELDLPLTGAAFATWGLSQLFESSLVPSTCRWCDNSLNGVDSNARDALRWSNPKTAGTLSDISGFALAPALSIGTLAALGDGPQRWTNTAIDALVVAEAVGTAGVACQVSKFAFARERPYARTAGQRGDEPAESHVSFYSGHTSFAFSLAVASGTVASARGYRGAGWVWALGLGAAAATGYLRVAADQHYLTDVLTGAAMGSAVSAGVVWGLHTPSAGRPVLAELPGGGAMVGWRGAW